VDKPKDIFTLIAQFADDLHAIDPNILYAPVSMHNGAIAVVLQVGSDEAVARLSDRFALGPVYTKRFQDVEWKCTEGALGRIAISVMGLHRKFTTTTIAHPAELEIV